MVPEEYVQAIQNFINVSQLFLKRIEALEDDLNFFKESGGPWFSLKRLDHESMFLCIDAYGFHEAMSKKRSLFEQIKQSAAKLKSIKEVDDQDRGGFEWGGTFGAPEEELESEDNFAYKVQKKLEKDDLLSRRKVRCESGIESSNHTKLEEVRKEIFSEIDSEAATLGDLRNDFAHRLDCLAKTMNELEVPQVCEIETRLNTCFKVIEFHRSYCQGILSYHLAMYYEGLRGQEYIALSRLKLLQEKGNT